MVIEQFWTRTYVLAVLILFILLFLVTVFCRFFRVPTVAVGGICGLLFKLGDEPFRYRARLLDGYSM